MSRILLLDDSTHDAAAIAGLLDGRDSVVFRHVTDVPGVLRELQNQPPDLLLVDPMVADRTADCFYAAARSIAPHTPILIVSARGGEEAAVRALRRGAASFVPKHLIQVHLWETIQSVLQVARQERCQLRMLEQMTELRCTFDIDSDPQLVAPLVSYVQEHMSRLQLCDRAELTRVGIAVHEALTNAIYHGNLELDSTLRDCDNEFVELCQRRLTESPYATRRVGVELHLTPQRARITIRDEGPGFDPKKLPDPTNIENVDKVSGRGIFLIRTFMDRVRFSSTGNEIVMWKHREQRAAST